ncbi:signal recognition particle-docking protein FtsY [Mesorhizobium sp. ZC-5]|uniref:signal recognition particle-docking protein FtsY n=1 Tax=Mesorhizobium sp. ZC-5 TaxID=2986066 RepID=UPI0021E72020|nr:signal recognition particle-docking protein FtsY [Mesorhizobium sp. ZC-5]MCV3239050.1 signal recognition particle-docking protein FtsY [Mesorhizobium sp. ZC-5]
MAFGFIKKVFSFGKKEVVEEKIDETAPLPPLNFDALKELKAETSPPVETPPQPAEVPVPAEPVQPAPVEEPQPEAPEPLPPEPAEPEPEEPAPEPSPAVPEPAPVEIPAPAPEPVREPEPLPQEIPAEPEPEVQPVEVPQPKEPPVPEPAPVEVPVPPAEPVREPEPLKPEPPTPVEVPAPVQPVEPGLPPAEVPPPVRQPPLVETRPVLRETAPEPDAIPQSPAEAAPKPTPGKVTVSKAVEKKVEPQKAPEPAPKTTWFQRLRDGLSRSSKELSSNIAGVFTKRKLDEDTLQDLEDVLIRADLGMETAIRITDALASGRYGKDVSESEVRTIMAQEVERVLGPVALPLELDLSHKPHVILVVGVNGTGKTTTIGKLAAKLVTGGLSVTLAAGDTFRAAAIEQLKIWGERTGSPVVASKLGADAAGLAYDAFEKAKEAGSDVLIIDTAGRLQNRTELMAELEKIVRVLGKLDPEAPHTVLQTVDATTGQNALNQVEIFRNVAGVNGLVMTKLDGTARGGILVAIAAKHKLPVYFIGVGEQVDDLEPFSASDFAKAIAGVA